MATNNALAKETPVCKFHKEMTEGKKSSKDKRQVSQIKIASLKIERSYAACNLASSATTQEFYQNLNTFELSGMVASADIIKSDIDARAGLDTGELSTMIADASKLLGDLQSNLHAANNAACSMHNCFKSLLGKDNPIPPELNDVTDLAKKLSENGKDVADAMVKVAGIHTFSNLETLQPFAGRLVDKLKALKSSTDELAEGAGNDGKAARDELTEVLKQLNQEEFNCFHSTSEINAYTSTLDFICKERCEPITCVEAICKKLGGVEAAQCEDETTSSYVQNDEN